nr:glycosyltransferase family 4 protein [uncultured Desulfobacter sp.]
MERIPNGTSAEIPLRVVFFSHSPRLEGAEKSLLSLAEFLRQQNKIEPLIVLPRSGRFSSMLKEKNIRYLVAPRMAWWVDKVRFRGMVLGPLKWIWNYFSWLFIRNDVKRFRPDIAYINTLVTPFGRIAAKDLNIPLVWHVRETIPKWLGVNYDFGRKWSLTRVSRSDAIIGNSIAVMKDISGYIPIEKSHVVYNGIKLYELDFGKTISNYDELSEGIPIRLLIAGSIMEQKGQATAVKCIAYLKEKGIQAVLILAGEEKANYGDTIRSLAKSLGVHQQVIWKGWQKDVRPLYKNAHITLSCSHGEPFGRTIIESMAYGTPVICSNSGGAPEIVKKVDPGLLFEDGDYKALAKIIINLGQNRSLNVQTVINGRKIVEENFSLPVYAAKIFQILWSVTASRMETCNRGSGKL